MTQTATRNRGIPERQDSIESLAWVQGRWEVAFGDGKRRRPRFLVDAAGRKSPLGTRLGARRHTLDQMVALAVRIPGTPDSRTAMRGQSLVESMRDGWWYAAPLPDGSMVIQLMTDADIARDGALRTPEAFLAAWRQTEGLSDLIPPPATTNALGPIATFPAQTGALNKAAGPGWVAVGDALIGFDPLTSSGIAGAFSDAWAALPVVARWLEEGPGTTAADAAITYGRAAQGTMIRYLRERSRLYSEEHRWPKAPFWARRTQADPVSV
jgi:2-polyprenyl-6-methoxyphenol hydroxylase-like FAD-dependent oxidoreductase